MDKEREGKLDLATRVQAVANAIRENRVDEAEALLVELNAVYPDPDDLTVFGVVIAIQRGQAREALWALDELPGDQHPELKALCLWLLKEPTWEGRARELEQDNGADPYVRKAMQQLLGHHVEEELGA